MITDEAVDELASVLLRNVSLQEFNLSYNDFYQHQIATIRIFKGMKNISSLKIINISHNMITDEAADDLATVLLYNTCLKEINLSFNCLSTLSAIKIFEGMKDTS